MTIDEKSAKSKVLASRVPREIIEEMETVKLEGESTTHFIVSAMRGEIIRRKTEGGHESTLLSSLDALTRVESIGTKAVSEIEQLISIAREVLQRQINGKV